MILYYDFLTGISNFFSHFVFFHFLRFAGMFAVCLAGEPWKRLDMIGAVVCLMGVVLIAHPTWLFGGNTEAVVTDAVPEITVAPVDDDGSISSSTEKAIAIFVTLAGAAMAGVAYVSVRLIRRGASAHVMVIYYGTMSLPLVILGAWGLKGNGSVWNGDQPFSIADWFLLLFTGLGGWGGKFDYC